MADPFALPWLLPAPADFRARLQQLKRSETLDAAELRALVRCDLDASQLEAVSKLIARRADELKAAFPARLTLGIVSSHTASVVAHTLPAVALRQGMLLNVALADYGQAAQELLGQGSALASAAPDLTLIDFDPHALGLDRPRFDPAEAERAVSGAIDYIVSLVEGCRANLTCPAIVQTLVAPPEPVFGSLDASVEGTPRWMIGEFNSRLVHTLKDSGNIVFDAALVAATVGLNAWFVPRLWHDAKLPFAIEAVGLYDDHLCRILAASRGLSKKCLVLDLDNTLWGGVIGDDGVDGIKLGQGSGTGEAHLAIQALAFDLRQRGVVLAVCSKNEEEAALLPFRHHTEMILKEDHVSVFMANWTDKATNLRAIAQTLNIGTDALVFLDDNPAEREQVRQALPEVAVPEVGDNPADYVRILAQAGYFDALSFGAEDRSRAEMYSANARRTAVLQRVGDLGEYLRSLEMVCTIAPFDGAGRSRIAQLTNKSNQFNLTTRRRTEAEVAAVEADPAKFAVQVRLEDRFGDNGMISVVIFERGAEAWHCDTWLMSCRVLGRRVEEAVLAHVAEAARAAGAKRLTGAYIPTAKNALVRDHFAKLGFTQTGADEDGTTRWALDLADYVAPELPLEVVAVADREMISG